MTSYTDTLQLGAFRVLGLAGMDDLDHYGSLIGAGMPGAGAVDMDPEPAPAEVAGCRRRGYGPRAAPAVVAVAGRG